MPFPVFEIIKLKKVFDGDYIDTGIDQLGSFTIVNGDSAKQSPEITIQDEYFVSESCGLNTGAQFRENMAQKNRKTFKVHQSKPPQVEEKKQVPELRKPVTITTRSREEFKESEISSRLHSLEHIKSQIDIVKDLVGDLDRRTKALQE